MERESRYHWECPTKGSGALFLEDAFSFLEDLPPRSVDLLFIDPPYSGKNKRFKAGGGSRLTKGYQKEGSPWFADFSDDKASYSTLARLAHRVLHPKYGQAYIMFDDYSLIHAAKESEEFLKIKSLITWDKVHMGLGRGYRNRTEFLLWVTPPGSRSKLLQKNVPNLWRIARIHPPRYPTQKPVELFRLILRVSFGVGEVICDPFMGSGSSAVAVLQEAETQKRALHYLGNDIAADAVHLTRSRVEAVLAGAPDPLAPQKKKPPGPFWENGNGEMG